MKHPYLRLLALACLFIPIASCRGQNPKPADPANALETFNASFTSKQIKGWSTHTVDKEECIISDAIKFPARSEINFHELEVFYTGEGTVQVSIAHSASNNLADALAKAHLHSKFKTVAHREKTSVISPYKGEKYAWIILRTTGKAKAKVLSAKYSCLWGKNTLYGHVGRVFEYDGGKLLYRLMAPKNYNPRKKYPLVLTVSGSGGVGNDNSRSMEMVGLARQLFIKYYGDKKHDCFSLVTQVPDNKSIPTGWFPKGAKGAPDKHHRAYSVVNEDSWYTQATLALIKELAAKNNSISIDPDRIYFTGFSLGGKACWEFMKAGREVFAGALSCGGWPIGMPYRAPTEEQLARLKLEVKRYKHIPVQIFAGEKDNMKIPSKVLHKVITDEGGKSTYTEFPGASHVSSANKVWGNVKFIDWLFKQDRSKNPKPGKDPYPNGVYE